MNIDSVKFVLRVCVVVVIVAAILFTVFTLMEPSLRRAKPSPRIKDGRKLELARRHGSYTLAELRALTDEELQFLVEYAQLVGDVSPRTITTSGGVITSMTITDGGTGYERRDEGGK